MITVTGPMQTYSRNYVAFDAPCVSQEDESQATGSRDDRWVAVTIEKSLEFPL